VGWPAGGAMAMAGSLAWQCAGSIFDRLACWTCMKHFMKVVFIFRLTLHAVVQRSSDRAIAYKWPNLAELLKSAKQEFSSRPQQHTNFGKFLLTGPWCYSYIPSKSAIKIAARC
jgi:hypothetical protein